MTEITDAVLSILQSLQAEMSEIRARLGEVRETQGEQTVRLDEIAGYTTAALGHIGRHEIDLVELKRSLKDLVSAARPPESPT